MKPYCDCRPAIADKRMHFGMNKRQFYVVILFFHLEIYDVFKKLTVNTEAENWFYLLTQLSRLKSSSIWE